MLRELFLLIFCFSTPLMSSPRKELWVEIHDASPAHGAEKLDQILEVIQRHEVDKILVFVIPNHGGNFPLSGSPEFCEYLRRKEDEGVEIGAHGYAHRGIEFYTSSENASRLVADSMAEFDACGLEPGAFYPPRYLVRKGASGVIYENYGEVYLLTKVVGRNGEVMRSPAYEFTWFSTNPRITLPVAKFLYLRSRSKVFRLTLHLGRANKKGNLAFLEEFLSWRDSL